MSLKKTMLFGKMVRTVVPVVAAPHPKEWLPWGPLGVMLPSKLNILGQYLTKADHDQLILKPSHLRVGYILMKKLHLYM